MRSEHTHDPQLDLAEVATCIGCGCDDLNCCPDGCAWIVVDRHSAFGVGGVIIQ